MLQGGWEDGTYVMTIPGELAGVSLVLGARDFEHDENSREEEAIDLR